MMVLPWPGASAWRAPNAIATTTALAPGDQGGERIGEPVGATRQHLTHARRPPDRRAQRRPAWPHPQGRLPLVRGRAEHVARIAGEPVAAGGPRDIAGEQGHP